MPDEHRPMPQSSVQAAGQVAEQVVSGLQQQPLMLAIVVLNIIGIASALWFLHELMNVTSVRTEKLIQACIPHYGAPLQPRQELNK
jgi:hypothetical protein